MHRENDRQEGIEMQKETSGTVVSVATQWWLKVN